MIRSRVVAVALVAALAAFALAAPVTTPATAHEERVGAITIVHPRSRPVAQGQNGVIYLDMRNEGEADDRLLAVDTPLATKVELHESTMEDGIHRMEKVESIALPAGATVALAPGGLHVMLIGLKFALFAEETIPVTLSFERAGDVTVSVSVEAGMGHGDESGHGDH